ncbi:hypothetical protein [Streptomyces sp. NEAU-W12]|uniref:hypothetical protein n=1 Tax=Streptomyces sp. NEAU-W12 TaxID=2994668 RepID=UPI00224AC035|nr:hypothetical protein [Streptomyces sp. NEAU-W12]MCX2928407.1 hypothetical protein [Streptomyces sp. NEAU-W12]
MLGQLPQAWELSSELIGALQGVRLCGSVHVIAAAETLVAATGDLDLNEKSADHFQQQAGAVVAARDAFLDVCREDLAYTARWWQVRRRIKERRFLREQAERRGAGSAAVGVVPPLPARGASWPAGRSARGTAPSR